MKDLNSIQTEATENIETLELEFTPVTPADLDIYFKIQQSDIPEEVIRPENNTSSALRIINTYNMNFIKINNESIGLIGHFKSKTGAVYIENLIIRPEFRNKGLGKKAMLKYLDKFKDVKEIKLTVNPNNTTAIKLYGLLGFKITEQPSEADSYDYGEPRLRMTKINN